MTFLADTITPSLTPNSKAKIAGVMFRNFEEGKLEMFSSTSINQWFEQGMVALEIIRRFI